MWQTTPLFSGKNFQENSSLSSNVNFVAWLSEIFLLSTITKGKHKKKYFTKVKMSFCGKIWPFFLFLYILWQNKVSYHKKDHKQDQKSHQLLHLRLFFISFYVKGKRSNSIAAFCVEKRLLFFREKAKSFSTALFTDIINDFYNIAATVCSASIVVERSGSIVDIAKGDTFVCKYFRPPASFRKIDYCRFLRKSCKITISVILA